MPRTSDENAGTLAPGEVLRALLARRMNGNSSYSLRAFARDLGVSHTYLSLVMSGKKSLSLPKAIQFSQLLSLDENDSQLLMRGASREVRARALAKARSAPASRPQPASFDPVVESDRFSILNEWYHIAILDLTRVEGFRSDATWIARRLRISAEQARSAIDRLKRLRLLEENGGKISKTAEKLAFSPKTVDTAVKSFHRQMIQKAGEALDNQGHQAWEERDITSVTIVMDPKLVPEASRRIRKFRAKLEKWLETSGAPKEIYQFNLQLFPLTFAETSAGRGQVLKKKVVAGARRQRSRK